MAAKDIWYYFEQLTSIPRPSGHMESISKFLLEFGDSLELIAVRDHANNVIITKPSSPGMESAKSTILQAHMDMVPQKESGSAHNFEIDPIKTVVSGEWISADRTTLGADNGIGVAAMMAILADTTLKHGKLVALFTSDEETGMHGASAVDPRWLQADAMINLDSENDNVIFVGSAGGVEVTAHCTYTEQVPIHGRVAFRVDIMGLMGGHAGLAIGLAGANGNKLLARFLSCNHSELDIHLSSWDSGSEPYAIPKVVSAVITIPLVNVQGLKIRLDEFHSWCRKEYKGVESQIEMVLTQVELPQSELPIDLQQTLLKAINLCPNGVRSMIELLPDTVETSSNLAIVKIGNGSVFYNSLIHSSNPLSMEDLSTEIIGCFTNAQMSVELRNEFAEWQPNFNSSLLAYVTDVYKNVYGRTPQIKAIHAGLECGALEKKARGLEILSLGPTIHKAHTTQECVNIPSTDKFYEFLVKSLERI